MFVILNGALSQSQEKPVILSTKVGEQIDAGEREKYGIINLKFTDFKFGIFYRTPAGKYTLKVSYQDSDRKLKDTIINVDEIAVFNSAFRVEFFEPASKGEAPANPRFSIDSAGNSYVVKISNFYPDRLPFDRTDKKTVGQEPTVGFGASLSYFFVDFSPVQKFFEQVENYFRQQGWDIPKNKLNLGGSSMYSFNFYIRVVETMGIDLETGKSMNPDLDVWYSAGYLCYNLNLKKPAGIKPFAAIGLGKYSYYVESYYNATVNANGSYLEKITSSGSSVGFFLKTGCEIGPSSGGKYLPFCFNLFAAYSYFPKIETENYGYKTTVKLGGFRLGAGIRWYI